MNNELTISNELLELIADKVADKVMQRIAEKEALADEERRRSFIDVYGETPEEYRKKSDEEAKEWVRNFKKVEN